MTVHITLDMAVAKVAEVVDERPTFVYVQPQGVDSCVYYHEGKASCLIGCVLDRIGVPLAEAIAAGVLLNNDGAEIALDKLRAAGHITYDDHVPEYFQHVQDSQDSGSIWRNAQGAGLWYLEHKDDEGDD